MLGRDWGESSVPGLFSLHFSKDHFTDKMGPVDQFLKGMEDGEVSMGNCAKGQVEVSRKRPRDELGDLSEV